MNDDILLLDTCICFKQKDRCLFIKYDNIYSIQRPSLDGKQWIVAVIYMSDCQKDFGFDFVSNTKESAEKDYELLTNQLIKYHTKNNSLTEKLDKLLSMIEVIPGGEEYEKAKDRFVNLEK